MARELYMYGDIYDSTALQFIKDLEEAKDEDIVVRIATNGGQPAYMAGMAAKFKEHAKGKKVKVDGMAHSAGLFFIATCDDVEALEQATMILHRAAYSTWFEKSEYMTEELWTNLNHINSILRKSLESKIDIEKFEKITGKTLDEVFSNDTKIDVNLTAKQAKQIGLIKKVVPITEKEKARIDAVYATYDPTANAPIKDSKNENSKPKEVNQMDIEKLRAEHPAVFAQVVKVGAEQERDRVGAWLAFIGADSEQVLKGIKEGRILTQTDTSELSIKMLKQDQLNALKKDNPTGVQTETPPAGASAASDADKNADAFYNALIGK